MKISVALCVYNGERFLTQQLESIVTQTILPDEIIMCDDASTDSSVQILQEFKKNNPAIECRIFINDHNIGYVKNFEKAISLTSGDIIFLCDQDDIWMINKVEKIKNIFDKHTSIKGAFSNACLINDKNELIEGSLWDSIAFSERTDLQLNNMQLFDYILKTYNVVTGACLAFKKEVVRDLLPIKPLLHEMHDEYIALKLSSQDHLLPVNENLIYYRLHDGQTHGVPSKENWEAISKLKEEKFLEFFSWNQSIHDIERMWNYYRRIKFYRNSSNLLDHLLSDAQNYLVKFKNNYIKPLNLVKRKRVLLSWYRNQKYDVKWWHVVFK